MGWRLLSVGSVEEEGERFLRGHLGRISGRFGREARFPCESGVKPPQSKTLARLLGVRASALGVQAVLRRYGSALSSLHNPSLFDRKTAVKPPMTRILADFLRGFVDPGLESTLTRRVKNEREKVLLIIRD